mmetsp:Transcript_8935/g.13414  ORF Transcript_8935/g.13414 Transcript_8935/m.13414 type:complete len:632 (+) Transcript_8935:47-1942(+)
MDDHFDRMLAADSADSTGSTSVHSKFIKADKFSGSRRGYAFKMGPSGLGYYYDPVQGAVLDEEQDEAKVSRKRKLDSLSGNAQAVDKSAIDKLLEDADQNEIEMLTPISLKQMLLTFEKKITKNQTMRMKYPDQPEKFMDSELDLHKEINNLYAVSASPELYPTLVEAGSVISILGMIAHENTDISIAAIGLLQELTDPETVLETEEAVVIVDSILAGQGLELIVQNLSRLDESNEDDAQGVHDSMAIIENLVEVKPEVAVSVCEKTHILKYLLMRLRVKKFDENKLYCSEILSILLQADAANTGRLGTIEGAEDGVEMLLQIVFQYRKKDPTGSDERECVQNMFLCLCTALMHADNQTRFRMREGFELMARCLKENKFAAGCAVRVLSYATSGDRTNCERLLEVNGLSHLFPLFMGRGFPSSCKKADRREMEEAVISTISQLCMQLHDCTEKRASQRLLSKFAESDYEKTERCVELFMKFAKVLAHTETELDHLILTLKARVSRGGMDAEDAAEELDMIDNDDARYLKRLDGGLHMLQQVSVILGFICVFRNSDTACINKIRSKLSTEHHSLRDVQAVLREMAASIGDGKISDSSSDATAAASLKQRNTLIAWSACLACIEENLGSNSST